MRRPRHIPEEGRGYIPAAWWPNTCWVVAPVQYPGQLMDVALVRRSWANPPLPLPLVTNHSHCRATDGATPHHSLSRGSFRGWWVTRSVTQRPNILQLQTRPATGFSTPARSQLFSRCWPRDVCHRQLLDASTFSQCTMVFHLQEIVNRKINHQFSFSSSSYVFFYILGCELIAGPGP